MLRSRLSSALLISFLMADAMACAQAPRLDLAGDPLPEGAIARLGSMRYRPDTQHIDNVFISSDGNTVIGHAGGALYFWEATTGKLTATLRAPELSFSAVDQSPDGKLLAVAGRQTSAKPVGEVGIRVYDAATHMPLWSKVLNEEYHPYGGQVLFAHDGKTLITGAYDLRLSDPLTGQERRRERLKVERQIELSPDGKTLAVAGTTGLFLWDWQLGGAPRAVETGRNSRFSSLAFTKDGKQICTSDYFEQFAYDVATGKSLGRTDKSRFAWQRVSPDGKTTASGHFDEAARTGAVVLRDAVSGKEIKRLSAGDVGIGLGRWSKDGTRFVGLSGWRAFVWDVATAKLFGPELPSHRSQIGDMTFAADGRLLTNADRTIRSWNPTTGELLHSFSMSDQFSKMAVSRDGSMLATVASPSHVTVWDIKTARPMYQLRWSTERSGGVFLISFANDDQRLVTYGSDWYVRSWDTLTGKLKVERRLLPESVEVAKGDPDEEERLGSIALFDSGGDAVSPDGETYIMRRASGLALIDIATGKERARLGLGELRAVSITLSRDGQRLAAVGVVPMPRPVAQQLPTFRISVWDLARGKELTTIHAPPGLNSFSPFLFTPDGKQLIAGVKNQLHIWEAATATPLGTIDLPSQPLRLAFDDGQRLAVGFIYPSALIYDFKSAVKPAAKE